MTTTEPKSNWMLIFFSKIITVKTRGTSLEHKTLIRIGHKWPFKNVMWPHNIGTTELLYSSAFTLKLLCGFFFFAYFTTVTAVHLLHLVVYLAVIWLRISKKKTSPKKQKTSKQYKQDANYTSHIRIRNLVEGILSTQPPNLTPHYRRTETQVVCNSSVISGILSLWRLRHYSFFLSFYLTATDKKVKLDQERLLHRGNKKLGLRLFSESRESLLSKHRPQKSAPQHLAQPARSTWVGVMQQHNRQL